MAIKMNVDTAAPIGEPNQVFLAEMKEQEAAYWVSSDNLDQADRLYRQAIEIRQKAFGQDDPAAALAIDALATVLCRQKKYKEAEELYKQSLSILEKVYYPEHAKLGPVNEHLSECYIEQGRLDEAEPLLKKVLEIHQKTSRGDRLDILNAMAKLADLYRRQEKFADAETVLKKAVQGADSPWGPVEDFLRDLAVVYQAQGKNEEAEKAFKQAADAYRQRDRYDGLLACLRGYAEFLNKIGRQEESKAVQARADRLAKLLAA